MNEPRAVAAPPSPTSVPVAPDLDAPARVATDALPEIFQAAAMGPTGLEKEPVDCPIGCFSGDQTITAMAVIGWPVAAVGALLGSHLFVRRLLDRGIAGIGSEISQRSQ